MMGQIYFDWQELKFKGISVDDVIRWESLFPDVDVVKQLKVEMPIWLERKQNTKQAHKKNWTSFILNWLKRSQERSIR
jgi:hypothetical protein